MKIAVSIGDLNGIGLEIALLSHDTIKHWCEPIYCANREMLEKAALLLGKTLPCDMQIAHIEGDFALHPGQNEVRSGFFSFNSFIHAITLADTGECDAITTLPVSKEAWHLAGVPYRGHTEALRDIYQQDAIMMMGCDKLYVALFTEHIPVRDICACIDPNRIEKFLTDFHRETGFRQIAVLGLNPHAGDGGAIGCEDSEIERGIIMANEALGEKIFEGPFVTDIAFAPFMREKYSVYVAMYHDQGLIPLKTLYFEESVNISLNLPIIRTSVDHGTAFDIAYKDRNPSILSYTNAIQAALKLVSSRNESADG